MSTPLALLILAACICVAVPLYRYIRRLSDLIDDRAEEWRG